MKKEKIKMFHDLVLVKCDPPEEITKKGIFIPGQVDQSKCFATVLAVGKKVKGIKAGDRIVKWPNEMGQPFTFNGDECLVMREKYIFGLMEEK